MLSKGSLHHFIPAGIRSLGTVPPIRASGGASILGIASLATLSAWAWSWYKSRNRNHHTNTGKHEETCTILILTILSCLCPLNSSIGADDKLTLSKHSSKNTTHIVYQYTCTRIFVILFTSACERPLLFKLIWKAAFVWVTPYLVQLTFSLEACSWKNGDLVFQRWSFFSILETCMGIDDPYVKKPRWRRNWNAISKMIKDGLAEGMITRKLCVEVLDLVLTSFQTSFFSGHHE